MILPVISYGHPILRQQSGKVERNSPDIDLLITNMWETLYASDGCGLAAPQVNQSVSLFIVDSLSSYEQLKPAARKYFDGDKGIQETFINAHIVNYSGNTWSEQEGCLSIPTLFEEVERPWSITIEYQDRNFQTHVKDFHGATARIIQHEFDHTRGKLYLDYLKPITRRLMNGKLKKISKGQIRGKYIMKYTG